MKKITALILLAIMVFSLASCASPELVKMDPIKVTGITCTLAPDAKVDKEVFAEYYNSATVKSAAKSDDKDAKEVIVVTLAGDDLFTIFYLGDNEFTVTGSKVSKAYVITSESLAEYYNDIVRPEPELASINVDDIASAAFTNTAAEIDVEAIVDAHNASELIGLANKEPGSDTVILFYENGSDVISITSIGEDKYLVSGTVVKVDYIIKSATLTSIFSTMAE